MSNMFTVRNGTPVGNTSLCRTCKHAHIQLGYADSEIEVRCGFHYENPRLIPFIVRDCTDYADKFVPTVWEMEKMAIILDVRKIHTVAGFAVTTKSAGADVDED